MKFEVQDWISPLSLIKIENYALNGSRNEVRTFRNKWHAKIFSKQGEFGKRSRAVSSIAKNRFIKIRNDFQPSILRVHRDGRSRSHAIYFETSS